MKVFKRGNSLAGLSIFAFLLALLIIVSFAGCEAASLIPVRNKQTPQDNQERIVPEATGTEVTENEPPAQTEPEPIPDSPRFYYPLTGL